MNTYVALLRGIAPTNPNMGNANLRRVFEKLGFKNVQTVISSGNVIFQSSSKNVEALEKKIEAALPRELSFRSTTIIRSKEDLLELVKKNPFKGYGHSKKTYLNVTFLKNPSPTGGKSKPKTKPKRGSKIISIYKGVICSIVDTSTSGSPDLMLWMEKEYGKEITTRTWKTVHRILEKME